MVKTLSLSQKYLSRFARINYLIKSFNMIIGYDTIIQVLNMLGIGYISNDNQNTTGHTE